MPLPSELGLSPVEEDLQKLFKNAGLGEDETLPSQEWDLETIYDSYTYTDENTNNDLNDPSQFLHPSMSHGFIDDCDYNIPAQSHKEGYWEEEEEESRVVNVSLLSHIAMQLRDNVPRGFHTKGSIPYPNSFTGRDIVVCPILFHL